MRQLRAYASDSNAPILPISPVFSLPEPLHKLSMPALTAGMTNLYTHPQRPLPVMTLSSPLRLSSLVLLAAMVTATTQSATPFSRTDKLSLNSATPNVSTLPNYGLLELTLDLQATFDNPFNPDQVDVYGSFTSPKGEMIRVNGFLDQPFSRRLVDGAERIQVAGDPVWKIRFTPNLPGQWQYQVFTKDKSGTVSLPVQSFAVSHASNAGFVRRSEKNPFGFAYDNGKAFFGGRGKHVLGREAGLIRLWRLAAGIRKIGRQFYPYLDVQLELRA